MSTPRFVIAIFIALAWAPALAQDKTEPGGFTDPSRLTTQQLDRAIVDLRTEMATRLDADEKAAVLSHEDVVRVPTTVDKAIQGLRELVEDKIDKLSSVTGEHFLRIDAQFVERDKRADQLTIASSTAIAAALQAQKEAVAEQNKASAESIAKSEAATGEAISQLRTLDQSNIAALQAQLSDLKSRIDKNEGHVTGTGDTYNWLFAAIGCGGVLLAMFVLMDKRRAAGKPD
jgi:hypothetical protein